MSVILFTFVVATSTLSTCRMNMSALAIFQTWFWVRIVIGKFSFVYVLETFSPQKLRVLGACLHLADWKCRRTGNELHIKDSLVL